MAQLKGARRRATEPLCLQLPQPLVSRHLGILRDAGVVTVQPEGRNRRYEVIHPKAAALVPAELKRFNPTEPANAAVQVVVNGEWWGDNYQNANAEMMDTISG